MFLLFERDMPTEVGCPFFLFYGYRKSHNHNKEDLFGNMVIIMHFFMQKLIHKNNQKK